MRGERLARRWVAVYTHGLPDAVRAEREAELVSDLWEQRAAMGGGLRTELSIVSRCARGIHADLGWRWTVARPRRRRLATRLLARAGWSLALCSYVFLVVTLAVGAAALLPFAPVALEGTDEDVAQAARVSAVLLALFLGGAVLLRRLPSLGAALLAVGALGMLVAFHWAVIGLAPITLSVAGAGVALARRRRARGLSG